MEEVTVGVVGNSVRITIPSSIVHALDIKKGQTIQVYATDTGIFIPVKVPVSPDATKRKK